MKILSVKDGNLKISGDASPEDIKLLHADFSWIDIERMDPGISLALSERFGVADLGKSKDSSGRYLNMVLPYYSEKSKKALIVAVSDNFIITLHGEKDTICDEATASVNELMMAGSLNATSTLYSVIEAINTANAAYLLDLQKLARSIKSNISKGPERALSLYSNSETAKDAFSRIAILLLSLSSGATKIPGIKDNSNFSQLYSHASSLADAAAALTTELETLRDDAVYGIGKNAASAKRTAYIGIAIALISIVICAYLLYLAGAIPFL